MSAPKRPKRYDYVYRIQQITERYSFGGFAIRRILRKLVREAANAVLAGETPCDSCGGTTCSLHGPIIDRIAKELIP